MADSFVAFFSLVWHRLGVDLAWVVGLWMCLGLRVGRLWVWFGRSSFMWDFIKRTPFYKVNSQFETT